MVEARLCCRYGGTGVALETGMVMYFLGQSLDESAEISGATRYGDVDKLPLFPVIKITGHASYGFGGHAP